jgi:hypothetical protein
MNCCGSDSLSKILVALKGLRPEKVQDTGGSVVVTGEAVEEVDGVAVALADVDGEGYTKLLGDSEAVADGLGDGSAVEEVDGVVVALADVDGEGYTELLGDSEAAADGLPVGDGSAVALGDEEGEGVGLSRNTARRDDV